jgi:hypothetical protein
VAIDAIEAGLQASENYLSSLDSLIKSQILNSWPDKIPGIDVIGRALDNLLVKSETALRNAEDEIKTQIAPLIKNAIPDALSFLGSIAGSLDSHLTQLIGNIATTEDVLGTAVGAIRSHGDELAKWFHNNIAGSLGATALNILKEMEGQDADGINSLLDEMSKLPGLPHYFSAMLHTFRHRGAEWQALALPAILVAVLVGALEAMQEPLQTAIRQGAFAAMPTKEAPENILTTMLLRGGITEDHFRNSMLQHGYAPDVSLMHLRAAEQRLTPDVAAKLRFRGNWTQAQYETELANIGLNPERAIDFFNAASQLLPEEYIRSAWLRNIVSDAEHDRLLGLWGYSADTALMYRKLYFFIPPVQDLIHMAIRNVFNPEIVKRFELFGDFPDTFKTAALQQGVSLEWAQKYWGAHWIVPGNTEAFEMFQRTTDNPLDENADSIMLSNGKTVHNIIGGSTLRLLLREKDIAPFYRDKLTQLAYRPITRIDIRRLNKVGILDHAGVQRAYLDLGYSPEHALMLADFTEKLNSTATKDAATALITSLRHKVIGLYIADKLGADDVHQTLVDLGFSDAEIKVWLAEADLDHQAELVTAVEAGIGKLYVAGLIDAKDATKRMMAIPIPVDAMGTLFAKWDLAIEFRGGSEHIHKHRELTKGEVLESLIDGMIDEATAEKMIIDLGYDKTGADAEIGLALYKQLKASRKTQIDAIKAMYINGLRALLETSNSLDAMFVPPDQRDAYMSEWTLQRETRTERIPIATLRDMVRKSGFMDDPTALAHLKRHRFTDADATLLLQFWHGG